MREPTRIVAHLDMDAFYAAVEVRENPALAGKPVIIGHPGRRGVVSTCSYEARKFGVHSAMPSVTARRLCPDAIWVPGRMSLYSATSRRIRRILDDVSPLVEPLSIDEAFLDLTGIARDMDHAASIGHALKKRIVDVEGLTSSVGIAPNKFLAKVASDMDKPDALTLLPFEALPDKLWPLPVRRLWGVGPRTAERLLAGGIRTIGDLLQLEEAALAAIVGSGSAAHLQSLARGQDDRRVQTGRRARSISEERTYGTDLTRPADIDRALLARSEGIARQLRRGKLEGRTVQIKVRTGDYTTWTRAATLREPTDLAEPIVEAARELFAGKIRLGGRGVRLLGVGISGLEPRGSGQSKLFQSPEESRAQRLADAADAVRNRIGEQAITRARLLRRPKTDDDGPEEASSLPSVD